MPDWTALAATFAAFFIVVAAPGPAILAVSTVSAARGRRSGLSFGCGLGLGLAFWGLVAATGLGAMLQTTAHLLVALKIGGGLYLFWLAYGSFRAAKGGGTLHADIATPTASPGRWFVRGLTLNLSNPKAVLAWMAALSVGLGPDAEWLGVVVATAGCVAIGFATNAAYAVVFSVSVVMRGYARVRRWVDAATAALFALAGFGLIRSAFARG